MFRYKAIIRDGMEIILTSLIIVFFVKRFFVTTYLVPSGSMEPVIKNNTRIIVNRLCFNYDRGDIIAFVYPGNGKTKLVKRIVGKPGDTLKLRDGGIFVNDELVPRYRNISYLILDPEKLEYVGALTVPENCFYVLGDNTGASRDSRFWGFVPRENIIGRVVFSYWPLTEIGVP